MNAKTLCPTAEVQRTTVGQPAQMGRGSAAALPLLVEHSHISGLGGQSVRGYQESIQLSGAYATRQTS
jgi:hypothetical protein